MSPIQTLQVFNSGKPCGWLGQNKHGYWFHYASNNPQQYWVSLLMPPTTNFYQQTELFPVFAQHLPNTGTELQPLEYLHQHNSNHLGALSFANPDNPVVTPPLRIPPKLAPGQSVLIAKHSSAQYGGKYSGNIRKPFADTVVHHASCWPLVQTLQQLKKQADPNNRLHALRWALQAEFTGEFVQHPRPDMDTYQQQLYRFEAVHSVLNLGQQQFSMLANSGGKFVQVLHEVARTYCKNFAAEIELLQHLLPFIAQGHLQAHLVYQQQTSSKPTPTVLGLEYLPYPPTN